MMSVSKESIVQLRRATGAGLLDVRQSLVEAEGSMEKALELLRIKGASTAASVETRPTNQGKISAVIDGNVGIITELNCETDFAAGNNIFQSLVTTSVERIKNSSTNDVTELLSENFSGRTLNDDFIDAIGAIRENLRLARFERYVGSADSYICSYVHAGGKFGTLVELSSSDTKVFDSETFQAFARDLALQITALSPRYVSRGDVPAEQVANELRIEMSKADISSKPENLREKIALGRVDKTLSGFVLMEQNFVKDSAKTVADVLQELSAATGSHIKVERFTRYALGEESSS